ncbi:hypothetical protein HPB51_005230 [Rhipicephalus microplus]|uniref:Uncharacterized protein n=1 Tax=Rhipicephalus microplus TaxID=6941 RepID=A0A9J6DZN6_RHIMP|nr:hypothetical protein HPB51_005230 [Rhipicephalus microplus]
MLPQKKFRSVHKYGKRRKAWNKGQTTAAAVPVAVPDGACSSSVTEPLLRPFADCCEAESVEGATSSYVRPPDAVDRDGRSREPDCGGTASAAVATPGVRASNILSRVSAQIPSSEEIAQRAQTRRDVLDAVASKSASKRKLELLSEGCDENDGGKDSTFFIVNKKMLNGLMMMMMMFDVLWRKGRFTAKERQFILLKNMDNDCDKRLYKGHKIPRSKAGKNIQVIKS